MTRSASWSGVAAIWIAWSAVMPAALHAQPQPSPRVVVQRFRGPRGSALRRQLIRDLEDHGVVVLDDAEVRAARERLGFDRSLEGSQYVDLARELNVSAYVDGRVRRRRRRWAARIRVRNASDGERLGSATWGGRTAASLGAVRRNGYARLEEYLTQASSPAAAA
ncbi:MAG TPA: hypothetical protein RMH99_09695, partial [Sandaracinaceae bacterium LLY-WYZ-13_1]|nr:hypothetical protein [Sandaracinaceae bacterium LLY-WYZ-13_1]